ncbi:hypothetical protein DFH27DRAFT_616811 [Peziza echinospora]|nr:hypothetical protein DFH27DRAFT_616811 [Peziza echinospora]
MTRRIVTRNRPSEIPLQTSPNRTSRQNVIYPQFPRIRKRPLQVFKSHDDDGKILAGPHLHPSAKRRIASDGAIQSSNLLRTPSQVPSQSHHLIIPTSSPPASGVSSPRRRQVSEIDLTANTFNNDLDGEQTFKVVREFRSVHTLPSNIKVIMQAALEFIIKYLHFDNPLPDVKEILELIADPWANGCRVTRIFQDQPAEAPLKSVLSRTRFLSAFTFKAKAPELFKLKNLPVKEVKKRVDYLLEDD